MLSRGLKDVADRTVALLLLIVLAPLMAVLAAIIRVTMGAPVLFQQDRPGRNGEVFRVHKFRTMNGRTDAQGDLLPDRERLTRMGKLLRATSLDELPQLWNVLVGEMSLVGPRPLLVQYLERYSPRQARRHDVKPGITGWAQVNGRNAITWDKRLEMDVWYVENWSLLLDLRILLLTLKKVIVRDGISAPGEATVSEFMGAQES